MMGVPPNGCVSLHECSLSASLSLSGFKHSEAESASTPHSVALRINTVTKLKPSTQEQHHHPETGRNGKCQGERFFFPGGHSHRKLQRKEGINTVLKTKHQKRNKMSRSMKYAKCLTQLGADCGAHGRN